MTLDTPGCSRHGRDLADLLTRVEATVGPVAAALLYGSEARGSAGPRSDTDVLALVAEGSRSVSDGSLTITTYLPGHLRALAIQGSLFVLHLIHDGIIFYDPRGSLQEILAAYRPPVDPGRVAIELSVAASGLIAATDAERKSMGPAMQSLAFYLLRSGIYGACARQGKPQFDSSLALRQLGMDDLSPLLKERREPYSEARLNWLLRSLPVIFPAGEMPKRSGLAATAVAAATKWPVASDLLAGVVAGGPVNYTTILVPTL